jgi:SSS family solute:Na+ symporter
MLSRINWIELLVFLAFFTAFTALGFLASRWHVAKKQTMDDWGLGGRQFGTLITWFLVGGDFYTAYTIIAVPALVYGVGAAGFFALPYSIIVYPFVFAAMPRLWSVCQKHGLVTPADFVRSRYGSHWLAAAVAITGVLAVMPYIALQLVGMEVVFTQMGLKATSALLRDFPITVAFGVLTVYTYSAGLRAPAFLAFFKDVMIYIIVIAAIVAIPLRFGGYSRIFHLASAHYAVSSAAGSLILRPGEYGAYASLALGSALAAFMYPHTVTSVLASANGQVIRRNAVFLPAYTLLLGLIAVLGIAAAASGLLVSENKEAVPALLASNFPRWFTGFSFAGIAIAALVPAAIMSIAAANLFTRNLYLEYLKPHSNDREQTQVAKRASLVVELGALFFVLVFPTRYAVNLQLLGGIWILQTFPAIALGLWGRWFHHRGLLIGWACGMGLGTYLSYIQRLQSSTYPIRIAGYSATLYIGLIALALNLLMTLAFSLVFDSLGVPRLQDATDDADYLWIEKQALGTKNVL